MVPREMKVEHSARVKAMSDEEIEQAIEAIQTMLAVQAEKTQIIEATAEPTALPGPTEVRQLQRKRSECRGEANLSSLSKSP